MGLINRHSPAHFHSLVSAFSPSSHGQTRRSPRRRATRFRNKVGRDSLKGAERTKPPRPAETPTKGEEAHFDSGSCLEEVGEWEIPNTNNQIPNNTELLITNTKTGISAVVILR